jgi:signal transduction histidine kinase
MAGEERATARWFLDLLWLLFLLGLALLPPVGEIHKQIILLGIGVFQIFESRLVSLIPQRGRIYAVLMKIGLASILISHTGDISGINSSYYPIYYLPVMTAAMYFGPWGTLLWTAIASTAYLSYLIPALYEFQLTTEAKGELSLRILFFFLIAMIVNRFVMGYREENRRYQLLAENLTRANEELKKAQAEARRAERLAALGQLSAGLAHEIRNPLGVIKGSAEILNQKVAKSDPLVQELASYIYTEVNRLSALVTRFLDFARPSRLELHPVDLPALMDRALKSIADQIAASKITVKRDYASAVPPVMVDEQLCDQVFTNLLCNACEAMEEQGGGLLNVRVFPTNSGLRPEVMAEIEDTGPGIPAELREQIFNPFVTTKKTGVGLGLAIVSKIVDAHGGTVRVKSEPGRGACFQVLLPQAERSAATTKEQGATL